ncbi:MAG: hypothetical protein VX519_09175 [Myxococcota bacterium]|nr:hypothetical protein [Myxococcota bacterium]
MKTEILEFLRQGGDAESLALRLYAWQVEHIPHYAAFCAGAKPETLEQIPAVPVSLFRELHLCISEQPGALFRTSGTTTGVRGVHHMPDTEVYDLAATSWFETCVKLPSETQWISLVPNPVHTPDSSLGHMVATLAPHAQWFLQPQGGVQLEPAVAAIQQANSPVFIAATALALADLLEASPSAALPAQSTVMITGGYKGMHRTVSESELESETKTRWGSEIQIIREYGMTELSSQLWDTGEGYLAPPWLRVYTIDPVTGEPSEGSGVLCFVDLANWGSCLAIETQDLGQVEGQRVILEGRLAHAVIRGCSLTAELS